MQLQTQSWTRSGRLLFAHSAGALRVTHCLGVGQPVPRAVLVFDVVDVFNPRYSFIKDHS